jgi:NADPH-dependent 2,4-dienoyl-CoA reductase/sulfur reductase-like enzyme
MTTRLVAIGGSDAGISAALRARELDPGADVTVVVADEYPNFSICGIPYYVSGEVTHWRNLAHRTSADLEATGMKLALNTTATHIDADAHTVTLRSADGSQRTLEYDAVVIGTGALPVRPPIGGLDHLGAEDGVHLLHSMGDTFALMRTLEQDHIRQALIVGAGYIGLEMAEGLTARGLSVIQIEQLPAVLPTVDPELGALVRTELQHQGVEVLTNTRVDSIARVASADARLQVNATGPDGEPRHYRADVVLISVGTALGVRGAIHVDRQMRTNLPDVFAGGDCAITHHRLLGDSYLPLGTTAHKQGRVAGENALGGSREFAGSLGTQVVKIFGLVAARTGLRDHEAAAAGFTPQTVTTIADDHKAYYPGSQPITIAYTGDTDTGQLLGVQLIGRLGSEIAKRVDIAATAIYNNLTVDGISDLDLACTPPLGSPWDAIQAGAQAWVQRAVPTAV